ncbi:MAG: hypothetical protein AAGI15_05240 [Pseudomonadota bacterium]
MTTYVIPKPDEIAPLLEMVFGEGVEMDLVDQPDPKECHAATFICDEDKLVALCHCDPSFVIYSGAALSMLPANVADEMIKDKEYTDVVKDNFYEVMNICSKLLMSETSAHLRLAETLDPEAAAGLNEKLPEGVENVAYRLKIPNFGEGQISFSVS